MARRQALQVLYSMDTNPLTLNQALRAFQGFGDEPEMAALDCPEAEAFFKALVEGTRTYKDQVDEQIKEASKSWRIGRMSRVDRNILRMAVFELYHIGEVPKKVTLNEAVEVAKAFGSSESPAFVNGVLDCVARGVSKS